MLKILAFRLLRGIVATAIAGWIATWQNNPKYMGLVPALYAAGKWLRETFPGLKNWVPV